MNANHLTAFRSRIMLLVLSMMLLIGMGIDLFVPSLPAIAGYFSEPATVVKLTISLYLLGYAFMQFCSGFMVDQFGRRPLMIVGLAGFVVSSFIAASSTSIVMLLISRLLQGISIAAPSVAARAMMIDTFTGKDLSTNSNKVATFWSLGVILSPVAGGYLQSLFHWQATFILMAVYALIILALAVTIPETRGETDSVNLRQSLQSLSMMFRHKLFLSAIIVMSFSYSLIVIFHVVGPFLVQNIMHYSAKQYGYVSLGLGVGWLIGTLVNRQLLIKNFSEEDILKVAAIGLSLSTIALLFASLHSLNLVSLLAPIYLMTVFAAIFFVNAFARSLNVFKQSAGMVSAIIGSLVMLGGSVFSSVASLLKAQSMLPMTMLFGMMVAMILLLNIRARKMISISKVTSQNAGAAKPCVS